MASDEVVIKDRHVEELALILCHAVKKFRAAPLVDAPFIQNFPQHQGVKKITIENVARSVQLDYTEVDAEGHYNPNVAACVVPALNIALKRIGREIFDRDNNTDYGLKTVSVGGVIGPNTIQSLVITGRNLIDALMLLDEAELRDAAPQAIYEHIEALIASAAAKAAAEQENQDSQGQGEK